jgi:hypothetical protein
VEEMFLEDMPLREGQLRYVAVSAEEISGPAMSGYFLDAYNDVWAQTRKAASYGFSKILYTAALDRGYPRSYSYLSEVLNQQDTLLPLVNKHLILQAKKALGQTSFDASQWNAGFESVWLETFGNYNPDDPRYGQNVISKISLFLPLAQ